MAKRMKNVVDDKTTKVFSIIAETSEEITTAAQEALVFIEQIKNGISELNNEMEQELITKDDALASYHEKVAPVSGRLANRIKKITKNTKAMTAMLGAIKALSDGEEKEKES